MLANVIKSAVRREEICWAKTSPRVSGGCDIVFNGICKKGNGAHDATRSVPPPPIQRPTWREVATSHGLLFFSAAYAAAHNRNEHHMAFDCHPLSAAYTAAITEKRPKVSFRFFSAAYSADNKMNKANLIRVFSFQPPMRRQRFKLDQRGVWECCQALNGR